MSDYNCSLIRILQDEMDATIHLAADSARGDGGLTYIDGLLKAIAIVRKHEAERLAKIQALKYHRDCGNKHCEAYFAGIDDCIEISSQHEGDRNLLLGLTEKWRNKLSARLPHGLTEAEAMEWHWERHYEADHIIRLYEGGKIQTAPVSMHSSEDANKPGEYSVMGGVRSDAESSPQRVADNSDNVAPPHPACSEISVAELNQLWLNAQRDDLFDIIVPSDVRRLLSEISRLRTTQSAPETESSVTADERSGILRQYEYLMAAKDFNNPNELLERVRAMDRIVGQTLRRVLRQPEPVSIPLSNIVNHLHKTTTHDFEDLKAIVKFAYDAAGVKYVE